MRKRCKLGQTDRAIIPYGYFTSSKCFLLVQFASKSSAGPHEDPFIHWRLISNECFSQEFQKGAIFELFHEFFPLNRLLLRLKVSFEYLNEFKIIMFLVRKVFQKKRKKFPHFQTGCGKRFSSFVQFNPKGKHPIWFWSLHFSRVETFYCTGI